MATAQERHPELFEPLNYESPRGKKRTVPLECLCLGFNRTGTASMCAAMEILGLHYWHSFLFFSSNYADMEMWQDAIDRKFFEKGTPFGRGEFDQLLHNFGAVSSDTPAIAFSDELIAAYPEAKVVLVERNIDSWYRSFMANVIDNIWATPARILYWLDPWYVRPMTNVHATVWDGWAGIRSPEDAKQKAKIKYREHYANIRKITPPERLLEFKLSDGWEPLCHFLGKPVPDVPFPHVNDTNWVSEKINLAMLRGLKMAARKFAIYGLPVVVGTVAYLTLGRQT